jgi:hypothetical protein
VIGLIDEAGPALKEAFKLDFTEIQVAKNVWTTTLQHLHGMEKYRYVLNNWRTVVSPLRSATLGMLSAGDQTPTLAGWLGLDIFRFTENLFIGIRYEEQTP